jgi:sodium/bile acid cotransporter 7
MPGVKKVLSLLDPFILSLLATVAAASLLPARGETAHALDVIADWAIFLLFFLHGAKLSREAIIAGALNWRLQVATLLVTFSLFPLLGLGASHLPLFDPSVAKGLLFLALLPSTVQSSIAFTAIARGNVAGAVCAASFSNLAGIVLTPLLVGLLMHLSGGGNVDSLSSTKAIALQLLLPFVLGHLARPLVTGFITRHKSLVTTVDRGSILLIVYTAFSAAVVEGLWHRVSASTLLLLLVVSTVMLAIVLGASWTLGRLLGLSRADRIVLLFCGSKKSLASGVPMAGAIFPAAQVGLLILPLMLFHQVQLFACAFIARGFADRAAAEETKERPRAV